MALKAILETLDDLPDALRDAYTERDGKFHLQVEGMRSEDDVRRLSTALERERGEHKVTKGKFSALGDRKPEDILAALDRIPELEAAANGKLDEAGIERLVEGRLKTKLSPLERERATLQQALAEREQKLEEYARRETSRTIADAVRKAAAVAKIIPEAYEDALVLAERTFVVAEDGSVVTKEGGDLIGWFSELQKSRPHWWGTTMGGGANGNRGGGGNAMPNPWTAAGWNMTEQGRVYIADPQKAEQMAKAAGTTIGGPRPKPR